MEQPGRHRRPHLINEKQIEYGKDPGRSSKTIPIDNDNKRRTKERRQLKSKGYIYITMVGWMDRREKKRRVDDSFEF